MALASRALASLAIASLALASLAIASLALASRALASLASQRAAADGRPVNMSADRLYQTSVNEHTSIGNDTNAR